MKAVVFCSMEIDWAVMGSSKAWRVVGCSEHQGVIRCSGNWGMIGCREHLKLENQVGVSLGDSGYHKKWVTFYASNQ